MILSPAYATLKPGQKARVMSLFARATDLIARGYTDVSSFMLDSSMKLGEIESKLAAKQLNQFVQPYLSEFQASGNLDAMETRRIAVALKNMTHDGFEDAVKQAAELMARKVPNGSVLVPIPGSGGDIEANRILAEAIAKLTDSEVIIAVERKSAVESSMVRRRAGQAGLTTEEQAASFKQVAKIPEGSKVVFVDNVETTRNTISGAAEVLGVPDRSVVFARAYLGEADKNIVAWLDNAKLRAIAEFPIEGLPFGDWWQKQADDMSIATRRQIQIGLLNGETPGTIARRIIPANIGETAVLRTASNSARMLVRTTFTTVQNQSALQTYERAGRGKVSDSYKYVAVRDSRTSPICRALDGRIFRYDDPKKKLPPQHPNCRSTITPVVNYGALGLDKTSEQVFSFGSYNDWLKDQPASTVSSILGARGADLYGSGKATLAELVTGDGRRLTTAQLASAFGVV